VIETVKTSAAVDNIDSSTVDRIWEQEQSDWFAQKGKGERRRRNRRERRVVDTNSLVTGFPKPKGWNATLLAEEFENDTATMIPRVRGKQLGRQNEPRRMKWDMGQRSRKKKYRQIDVTGDHEVGSKPPIKLTHNGGEGVQQIQERADWTSMSASERSNELYRGEKDRALQSGRVPSVRPTLRQQNNSPPISARANGRDQVGREEATSQSAYQTPDKVLSTESEKGSRKDAVDTRRKGGVTTSKIIGSQELCDRGNWPMLVQEDKRKMVRTEAPLENYTKGFGTWVKLTSQDGGAFQGASPVAESQYESWEEVRMTTQWLKGSPDAIESLDKDPQHKYVRSGSSNVLVSDFGNANDCLMVEVNLAKVEDEDREEKITKNKKKGTNVESKG
jgi:hypothetical protein